MNDTTKTLIEESIKFETRNLSSINEAVCDAEERLKNLKDERDDLINKIEEYTKSLEVEYSL